MIKVHPKGMESSNLVKKRVVVVGYGAAGSNFAVAAAKHKDYEVTVITPFEYMEVSLCMTKVIAAGTEEHTKVIYDLLREKDINYIVDVVTSVSDGSLTTGSGRNVPFDVCVVAVGQNIPIFFPDVSQRTMDARKAAINEIHRSIRNANNIVLGGSGPVGVEAAADIKLRFKDKNVTVVSPTGEVLNMMGAPFRAVASTQLDKMDIHVIHNDRVSQHENGQVTLQSGKKIICDLYIPAHATGGNATFLPAASRDAKGYAKVDDAFKVQGLTKVFAVGDCSNFDPVKTFVKVGDQMPTLVANVVNFLANKPLTHHVKGKSFEGKFNGPGMVALGHGLPDGYGVGPELPGCCLGWCCWFCCCCQTPQGPRVAKMKSDFNLTVIPRPGKGLSK